MSSMGDTRCSGEEVNARKDCMSDIVEEFPIHRK